MSAVDHNHRHAVLDYKSSLITTQMQMEQVRKRMSEGDCDPHVAGKSAIALEVLALYEAHCKRCIEYHSLPETKENQAKHDELLAEIKRWEFEEQRLYQKVQGDLKPSLMEEFKASLKFPGPAIGHNGNLSQKFPVPDGDKTSIGLLAYLLFERGYLANSIESRSEATKVLSKLCCKADGETLDAETVRKNADRYLNSKQK